MLDEAHRRVEDGQPLCLLTQDDGGEPFQVAVPLFDQLQLLVAKPEPVLLHLELAVEVLPVGDLESQALRSPSKPSGQQRLLDLADELERLFRLDYGVGAVDAPLLFEHLPQELGSACCLERRHLEGGRSAGAHADPQTAGLDLFARDVRVPEW